MSFKNKYGRENALSMCPLRVHRLFFERLNCIFVSRIAEMRSVTHPCVFFHFIFITLSMTNYFPNK